jgi:hypothetical protein
MGSSCAQGDGGRKTEVDNVAAFVRQPFEVGDDLGSETDAALADAEALVVNLAGA